MFLARPNQRPRHPTGDLGVVGGCGQPLPGSPNHHDMDVALPLTQTDLRRVSVIVA